ncbi:MAG: tetratricopeptide repeat protein [Myxococcota bacterium]
MVAGSDKAPKPRRPHYAPGTAVSRYVILYEVGAGGMGVVYAAFDPQLNRKIALKILIPKERDDKHGRDQAATRLMREAQAIARLSHPNVVNVYDVGRHGEAVFVAMEFIEGLTLTRWLELHRRSLSEICRIFAMAGRGLAAAHIAGLVHRDFKPDNVLVSPDGRVRVLDFGLARARPGQSSQLSNISHISHVSHVSQVSHDEDSQDGLGHDGVPHIVDFGESDVLSSPLTLDDTVVGTPRYMPPEQHAGVGVDARSDQFSFCVALYQALYHQDPFPASRLHDLVRLKQQGRIAPPPPDANVPPWLEDLVMCGLAPRPADRLASMDLVVAALEDDPEAKRRRRLTLMGGVVLLAGATAVVGHQLGRTERLCQDSERHVEPLWGQPRRLQVRTAILGTGLPYAEHTWSEVERRLDADLEQWVQTHQQTCEATRVRGEQSDEMLDLRMSCLQEHLSEVSVVLGVLEESDPAVVQRAVTIVSELPGIDRCADVERLRAALPLPEDEQTRTRVEELRNLMRRAQAWQSVRRVEEAHELAQEVLGEARNLGYEPLRVEALATLGVALENAGDFGESEARLRQALWGAVGVGHDRVALRAATHLVSVVGDRLARFEEGLTWGELADALVARLGEDGADRVSLMNNLGNVWYRKGDHAKALDHYQRAIAQLEARVSADDPVLAGDRINLGNAQLALGNHDAALASYQQAELGLRTVLGEGHPQVAMAVASIGVVYNETGRYAEALVQHRQALDDFEAWLGPEHLFVATTVGNIGVSLLGQGKLDEAQAQIRRSQRLLERSLGPDHPHVAASLHNLGTIRKEQGHYEEALRLYERAFELRRKRLDEDHEALVESRVALAEIGRLRGDPSGAVAALETLASQAERAQKAEWSVAMRGEIHYQLAQARWDAGQLEARVRADLDRARMFLRDAGLGGDTRLRELEVWALDHARDNRPRDSDGSILSRDVTSGRSPDRGGNAGEDGDTDRSEDGGSIAREPQPERESQPRRGGGGGEPGKPQRSHKPERSHEPDKPSRSKDGPKGDAGTGADAKAGPKSENNDPPAPVEVGTEAEHEVEHEAEPTAPSPSSPSPSP